MGSGLGYLTFAVHSYLTSHMSESSQNIECTGIELRESLVNKTESLARSLVI
jgi:hypothetical protein